MTHSLFDPEVQAIIKQYEPGNESELLLRYKHIYGIPVSLIVQQISGRRKAKEKLPSLYQRVDILYPPKLNLEQSSSEETAAFKISILKEENINPLGIAIDLTMGFGIDAFRLSRFFKQLECVEPDAELLEVTRHNHLVQQADNIVYHNKKAEEVLAGNLSAFELIYIDPSRRATGNRKVFQLRDCIPDVTLLLPEIFRVSSHILIKTSPLLDVKQGLLELQNVKSVYILSVHNECKELLFFCDKYHNGPVKIITVNLHATSIERFQFTYEDEKQTEASYADPLKYLYEPNASILKAGAFKSIGNRFQLYKIDPNTHFYTSEKLHENFPGRVFEINDLIKPEAKAVMTSLPDRMANVVTRNYPLTAVALKEKLKIKDGGKKYLIAFSGRNGKFLCLADRLK